MQLLRLNLKRSFIVCWLGIFLCVSINAQRSQDEKKKEESQEVLRMDTDLVSVDVSVKNKSGTREIVGLKADDFIVYEDGVRQKIENFSTMDVPFNVVLVIDTSGSTREEIDLMRRAAKKFLRELRPKDRVALVEFNSKINLLEDLTDNRELITKALDKLKPGGGTTFYDTIQLSVEEVLKNVTGRKAIIALTDGVDSVGYGTYSELLPMVERAKTSLYFLEVDTEAKTEAGMMLDCTDNNRFQFSKKQLRKYEQEYAAGADDSQFADHCQLSRIERMQINRRLYESARKELREMANKTGGRVYPVKELQQLESTYAEIARELRTQYSLGYYSTNDKHDGKWRDLKVQIKRPGLEVTAKPGYRAPKD